jgi:hypothetical protein
MEATRDLVLRALVEAQARAAAEAGGIPGPHDGDDPR